MTKGLPDYNKHARLFLSESYPMPQAAILKAPLALFPGERLVMGFPDAIEMRKFFTCLLGESRCDGGTKFVDGMDVSFLGPQRLAQYGVGFGSGRRRILPALTLEEHIKLRLSVLGERRLVKEAVEEVKSSFSALAEAGSGVCGNFSGGQQQAAMLALATLGPVKLVVIEEAWMGLSTRSRDEADQRFQALERRGGSVFILTQEAP
jgi:branched-chain amino acid transport system ATP-binding protein